MPDLDECVDRHRHPVVADDERVHVDARHVRALDGQRPEPDEQIDELPTLHLGTTAEGPEQLLGGKVVDHLGRRRAVDRSGPEHHVGHRLGEDPAHAEHHRRPELAIAQHADDQLAIPGEHRCDEQRHVAVGRCRRRPTTPWRRRARRPRRRAGGARDHVRSCGRSRRRTASPRPETRSRPPPRRPRRRSPRRARRRAAARIRPAAASRRPPTALSSGSSSPATVVSRGPRRTGTAGQGVSAARKKASTWSRRIRERLWRERRCVEQAVDERSVGEVARADAP